MEKTLTLREICQEYNVMYSNNKEYLAEEVIALWPTGILESEARIRNCSIEYKLKDGQSWVKTIYRVIYNKYGKI